MPEANSEKRLETLAKSYNRPPILIQRINQLSRFLRTNAPFEFAHNSKNRLLGIVAHGSSLFRQNNDRTTAIIGVGLQFKQSFFANLTQRMMNCLSGQAQTSGNVRGPHHSLDHIDHHHRLWARQRWPATRFKRSLHTFVEPSEPAQQRNDQKFRTDTDQINPSSDKRTTHCRTG